MRQGDKGAGSGANYSRIVWAFFMFQKWYEMFGPGRTNPADRYILRTDISCGQTCRIEGNDG